MGKIMIKDSFSDRNKTIEYPRTIQKNELNSITRNDIANVLKFFLDILTVSCAEDRLIKGTHQFIYYYTVDVLHDLYDNPSNIQLEIIKKNILKVIIEYEYDDIYAVLEYIAKKFKECFSGIERFQKFEVILNNCFEKNYVGYRFLNSEITPITDEVEINEIKKAIMSSEEVGTPLKKALNFMSVTQRDYQNAIKESFIAVETLLNQYFNTNDTFGRNWDKFTKENNIHHKLKDSLGALYGYTCDIGGVRHGGNLSYANVSYEEAQYVLVTCSGIINFIKSKSSKKK